MSPRAKHISDDAQRTSICLTAEENAAINWIREARRLRKEDRRTKNDILVDALWYFLEKTEGKSREQMGQMVPSKPVAEPKRIKIAEMPKPRNKQT